MDDMTQIETSTLVKTIFLDLAPEEAWAWFTKKEKLDRWYNTASADLVEGGTYALSESGNRLVWGRVIEWSPPERLVTTFEIGAMDGIETTVTWELQPLAGGTLVTLTHEGILEAGPAGRHLLTRIDPGWEEHFGKLRAALA